MRRALGLLRYAFAEFGSVIVFVIGLYAFGIKPAIVATIVWIAGDAIQRAVRRVGFPQTWLFANGLVVVFGGVDLFAATPFMLRYEPVVTNGLTGLVFAAGAFGDKPVIQLLAEARGRSFPEGAEFRRFFQVLTFIWVAYFALKAAVYYWLATHLTLEEAMPIRAVVGPGSLVVLLALSFRSRPLFLLLRRLRLLPAPAGGA
ncbi:MAG TPA: septation protein IspZ [Acetobacteraceae bacterium]|nr:septation protein IspZ [Acetobacteraceae bacterium]